MRESVLDATNDSAKYSSAYDGELTSLNRTVDRIAPVDSSMRRTCVPTTASSTPSEAGINPKPA